MRGAAFWIVRSLPVVDAVVLAGLLVVLIRWDLVTVEPLALLLLVLLVPLTRHFLQRFGVYDSHRIGGAGEVVRRILLAHLSAGALAVAGAVIVGAEPNGVAVVFACSFAILGSTRAAVYLVLRLLRTRGFDHRRVLFTGEWDEAAAFAVQLEEHPEWGMEVSCVACGEASALEFLSYPERQPLAGDLENLLRHRVIDEVLISVGDRSLATALDATRIFEAYGLLVRVVFSPLAGSARPPLVEPFVGGASLSLTRSPRTEADLAVKRMFDVAFGLLFALAGLPVMLIIAALIKMTSPGPILFSQVRVGMNGRRFRMVKFRTMVNGAEFLVRQADRSITHGPIFKDPADYRITPLGRLLRKFSLDELPQLWNVLKGEMSLVGPRPLPIEEADSITGEFRRRFSVPAGLTCIWQVSGRSDIPFERWMKYDLQYVDQWSLWADSILLLRTVPAVFRGKGGY